MPVTHITLQIIGMSKRVRVPIGLSWGPVRDFFFEFSPRCKVVFRDTDGDWCVIEDEKSWRDAVTFAVERAHRGKAVLNVGVRSRKLLDGKSRMMRKTGVIVPLAPRTLERPDGPWPPLTRKDLPPIVNASQKFSEDWVDVSQEAKKLLSEKLEYLEAKENRKSSVSFEVNGTKHIASNFDPRTSLARFLRDTLKLTGTKIGCGEGGCGACTVNIEFEDGRSAIVNSCLRPLAAMEGAKVTTIEGLGSERKGLYPAMERLAKCNGSQCGYCSPGMVMAMYGMLQRTAGRPSKADAEDAFSGNICRCTGYRPILEAAHSFADQKLSGGDADAKGITSGFPKITFDDEDENETFNATDAKPCVHELGGEEAAIKWYEPAALDDALKLWRTVQGAKTPFRLVCGSTSTGVVKYYKTHANDSPAVVINIGRIETLRNVSTSASATTFGAAVTLAEVIAGLESTGGSRAVALVAHLKLVANHQVRNAGSWAGNLEMARSHPDFPSDVLLLLIASGAQLTVVPPDGALTTQSKQMSAAEYVSIPADSPAPFIVSVTIPLADDAGFLSTHKVMGRHVNTHAYVNAAFCFKVAQGVITNTVLAIGALQLGPFCCPKTSEALKGKRLEAATVQAGVKALEAELKGLEQHSSYARDQDQKAEHQGADDSATSPQLEPPRAYRHSLALTLLYKSLLAAIAHYSSKGISALPANLRSACTAYKRPVSTGSQLFAEDPELCPVNTPVPKLAANSQASGEAKYTGDLTDPNRCLHACPVTSQRARASILSLDITAAMTIPGVVRVITAKDIKALGGSNNAGPFPGDEMIFAETEVLCYGQYVALVVATSPETAERAAKAVEIEYGAASASPVLSIDEAIKQGSFHKDNDFMKLNHPLVHRGDVDHAWSNCEFVVTGEIRSSGQCHFYMETQTIMVAPDEGNRLHIECSSQGPTTVRKQVSVAVNKPANKIRAGTRRAGGAFGGKISRNMPLATAVAVAAETLGIPVRAQLDRRLDMATTGGRHPMLSRYKVGFNKSGKILALSVDTFADAGYTVDDTFGLLDMMQTMMDSAYFVPNYRTTAAACKTNTITNTDMRSPGVCSGVFFMENILDRVAYELRLPPNKVREQNFYSADGKQRTPMGDPTTFIQLQNVWTTLQKSADVVTRTAAVAAFNQANRWRKRGIYCTPVKYGISQHGYKMAVAINVLEEDGTINVAHGGVEIGQGINTKVAQAVAYKLQVPLSLICITHNSTDSIPNATLTGGSGTSETVVNAALLAAENLLARLKPYLEPGAKWEDVVSAAYHGGVNLSAQGYWGGGPRGKKRVNPMYDYFVYAACCSEVELDVLTGEVQIIRSDIAYDCGKSLNQAVDVGQVEGAFIQSVGFYLTEDVVKHEKTGQVLTAGTWDYKPPTAVDIPQVFNVTFVKTNNPATVSTLGSKAVGEPPYQLGASVFFAAKQAVYAARANAGLKGYVHLETPASPVALQTACGVTASQLTM